MLNSSFQVLKMSILKIHAREIFDSRGNPTVEVDLYTAKGESLAVLFWQGSCVCSFLHTFNKLLSLLWDFQEKLLPLFH